MKKYFTPSFLIIIFALVTTLSSCGAPNDSKSVATTGEIANTEQEITLVESNETEAPTPTVVPDATVAPTVTPDEVSLNSSNSFGALQVAGTKLTDKNGDIIQLKGLSSHGLSWFPAYVNADMLRELNEEWNCNVFRLAMYTDDYNGYCVGDDANRAALEQLIDEAVEITRSLEMYLIIDWHILSDNNPLTHQTEAVAFFTKIAQQYQDEEHLIYEICNEPNGDTSWADVQSYARDVIPAIRNFTDAVILVGTPTWSQDIQLAAQSPLSEFDNIMYTLHFYAATHKDDLRSRMNAASATGLPIFVSEFGICDASGTGAIDEAEANLWIEAMDAADISYVMWNLSNKEETSAIINANCDKTSGITPDDLSPAGIWFRSLMVGND